MERVDGCTRCACEVLGGKWQPFIGPVARFVVWEPVVRAGLIEVILLPTPRATLGAPFAGLAGGPLYENFDLEMTLFIGEKPQEVFMQTGTTMMLVSHDLEPAAHLAEQVLRLTKRPTKVAEILQ